MVQAIFVVGNLVLTTPLKIWHRCRVWNNIQLVFCHVIVGIAAARVRHLDGLCAGVRKKEEEKKNDKSRHTLT